MKNTNNNVYLRKSLDRAVESGNVKKINEILNSISADEPELSSKAFAKEIRAKCSKEVNKMKLNYKIMIAVATIASITCVSVGAATLLKTYSFNKDGKYISITSNSDLSAEEAEKIAEAEGDYTHKPDKTNVVENEQFSTISEAEKKYDMEVILPEKLPNLEITGVEGQEMFITDKSKDSTIWLSYGDYNKKAFALTVTKNSFNDEDITSVSSSDAVKDGDAFVSEKGYIFDVLKDSNEESGKSANIYTTTIGCYEYSMVFTGFDSNEIKEIVDSVDLENYK